MCGIFGVYSRRSANQAPGQERLERTAQLLRHRGPDDSGTFADNGIGFASTRLSLLDINPRSAQPFWDSTGRYCLIYNGEIYNSRSIRRDLESRGAVFRTTSDTEVVLNAVTHLGIEEAVTRFDGMFAFAVWDRLTEELALARDPFGIKPLFIHRSPDRLMFASEIQAFAPWMEFRADTRSIISYLYGFAGPTDGRTFFEDVEFLSPGSILTVRRGEAERERRFFTVDQLWDADLHEELATQPSEKVVGMLEQQLLESVEQQLVADVPVGTLCSGGLDSSIVTAMAKQIHGDVAVFNADVVGPLSEIEEARTLAEFLELDLRSVQVRDEDYVNLLPRLTLHSGHPFITPQYLPIYKVSELIRSEGMKAVLLGEGADEGFLGYPWLIPGRTQRRQRKHAHNPSSVLLQPSEERGQLDRLAGRIFGRNRASRQAVSTDLMTLMLSGFEVWEENDRNRARLESVANTSIGRAALDSLDLFNYRIRSSLYRADTMGMAASVESRFPFLDAHVVRTAVNLPAKYKIRAGLNPRDGRHPFYIDKWILRRLARKYLPEGVHKRPKVAFPTTGYLRMNLEPPALNGSYVSETFGLSSKQLRYLLDESGQLLRTKLLHLEVWGEVFMKGTSQDQVVEQLRSGVSFRDQ